LKNLYSSDTKGSAAEGLRFSPSVFPKQRQNARYPLLHPTWGNLARISSRRAAGLVEGSPFETWPERDAVSKISVPRMTFAGSKDVIGCQLFGSIPMVSGSI
jgi:hypothetical protein